MYQTSSSASAGKTVVSMDTKVETKTVPLSNHSIQRITVTTAKKTFSDGSSSTTTETSTVTETTVERLRSSQHLTSSETRISDIPTTRGTLPLSHPSVTVPERRTAGNSTNDDGSSSSSSGEENDKEFSAFQLQALRAHNAYRAQHGAKPLTLSNKICDAARNWAKTLADQGRLGHSQESGYGENVYWTNGDSKQVKGDVPVDTWYQESIRYRFGTEGYQPNTGHFTQVVWKDSKELGIAKATGRSGTFVVANYSPPGNYHGLYVQNVSKS